MFVIRNEQMKVLSDDMTRAFERRMFEHLKKNHGSELNGISDEELQGMIHKGLSRAGKYGIVAEADVQAYLEYMVELGVDFDADPKHAEVKDILNSSRYSGAVKMNRIKFLLNHVRGA